MNKPIVFNPLKRKISAEELSSNKYISVAEYVKKFQFRTPDRFHTIPKNKHLIPVKQGPMICTVPLSPMLNTKNRTRPVYYTSHNEQEVKEAEEMKK